jgi:DHA2 family multidrug resistance protein
MAADAAIALPGRRFAGNPWIVAVAVSLAAFMEVLDTTITNVSLSHIAGSLGASPEESTWVLTSYLVANGIVLPLSGWLSGVFGRKRYFMVCIAAFTAASFACGAATSMTMLIVFRLVQGLAGGGLQPTQQAIIMDAFPPEKRGAAFGVTGITMIVAPILGPTLGGFITDSYSWRWIFYLNVPVGLFALWMVNMFVQDPDHAKAQGVKTIDYVGLGLIVIGLGALQIVLDKGQQEDWLDSAFIRHFATISAASLTCAFIWLWHRDDPVIDLKLLKQASFGLSCIMIFFVGFALYASSALLPILTQSQFGYNATLSGMVLSPGGMAVVFLMPIAGMLVGKIEARYLVAFGFFLCAAGQAVTSFVTPEWNYNLFTLARIVQVLGLPFLFIPISTIAFMNIPKEKSSKASALFAMGRNLGGSIGIALAASYIARHQQGHQTALVQKLTPTSPEYRSLMDTYIRYFEGAGQTHAEAIKAAMGRMNYELQHQVVILSYNDAFRTMAIIMMGLSLLALFFLPHNKPGAKGAPGGAH